MSSRFFIETPITGESAILTGSEAHHLLHVLRAKVGVTVTLFDNSGQEFTATVTQLGRSEVELSIDAREPISRELPIQLTLAVALPKGDRQKWLVEKATELGVTRLIPLQTERGVAQPVDKALDRLRRSVIEASKQCGRNILMQIDSPLRWPDLAPREPEQNLLRLIAHPGGIPLSGIKQMIEQANSPDPNTPATTSSNPLSLFAAIGPEGGFTDEEVTLADAHHWHKVSLGPTILRIETAALSLAAWAGGELGGWRIRKASFSIGSIDGC